MGTSLSKSRYSIELEYADSAFKFTSNEAIPIMVKIFHVGSYNIILSLWKNTDSIPKEWLSFASYLSTTEHIMDILGREYDIFYISKHKLNNFSLWIWGNIFYISLMKISIIFCSCLILRHVLSAMRFRLVDFQIPCIHTFREFQTTSSYNYNHNNLCNFHL